MSFAIEKTNSEYLYQQVVQLVRDMRSQALIRPGDKLPSLRSMANKLSVSVPTIKQGYEELERLGEVEARPKSGFFLKPQKVQLAPPKRIRLAGKPVAVRKQSLIEQVYQAIHEPGVMPLGVANPVSAHPSDKALARIMRRVMAQSGSRAISYGPMDGFAPLKRQLALRYLDIGLHIDPDDIVITNGAQEAIAISLQTVAKPGDVIAVESPCYFGILELIESLGMMAYEIPVCPDDGPWLEDLERAVFKQSIKACIFSTALNNPMGSLMPEANRKSMVQLLERHNIPLIEDDVYSDLYFSGERAIPAQAYSSKGDVLTCGSFSKTAAPGYRVGWLLTAKYSEKVRRLKRALSSASSLNNQWTLSEFIASGEYDRNMKQLRQKLSCHKGRMVAAVKSAFPNTTRISNPQGGGVLWLQLPQHCNSVELFHQALDERISIAPGAIFSPTNKYNACFRISFGLPWSDALEQAVITLGHLSKKLINKH